MAFMLISELNTRKPMSEADSVPERQENKTFDVFSPFSLSILLHDDNVFVIISANRSACLPFHQLCKQPQLSHDATNK